LFIWAPVDSCEPLDGRFDGPADVWDALASGIPNQHSEEDAEEHEDKLHVERACHEFLRLNWAAGGKNTNVLDGDDPSHSP
jgi:hypothetical protein